jgi:GAF domain-containing protein
LSRADDRITSYIELTERLRHGEYGLAAQAGEPDSVGRLGRSLTRLSLDLERQYLEASRLSYVATRINGGLLLEEVLDGVYRDFQDIIPYNRIGCALLEQDGTTLRARWARSDQAEILLGCGYSAPMAGSSLEDILCTGRPRILNDLEAYLAHKPHSLSTRLVVEEGFRSSLSCPLIANGVPAGFLFFSSICAGTYAADHVATFQRIAGQLSVIVEKARLVSELADLKQRLEEQDLALSLQRDRENRILNLAAHDLRSPLYSIRNGTELLLHPTFEIHPDERRALLEDILARTRHLLELLDDLVETGGKPSAVSRRGVRRRASGLKASRITPDQRWDGPELTAPGPGCNIEPQLLSWSFAAYCSHVK